MSRCARDETWQNNWLTTRGFLAEWQALPLQPKPDMADFLRPKGESIVYPMSDQDLQGRALSELSVSIMHPRYFSVTHETSDTLQKKPMVTFSSTS
jgi:hypothetical protein